MPNVPNVLQPDAKGIAEAVIREAKKVLVASHSDYAGDTSLAVARTLGTLFPSAAGCRPHIVEQQHLIVALAQAVLLQSQQIACLTRSLEEVRVQPHETSGRAAGLDSFGPARDRRAELELAELVETAHGRFGPPAHPNGGLGE